MVAADTNRKCPAGLVLIVEDDADTSELMRLLLEREGYTVHEAAHGGIALKLMSQHAYTCVLLDLIMPEVDGYVVLNFLRKVRSALPVIVVTGHRTSLDSKAVSQAYSNAIMIPKPFEAEALLTHVKAAADGTTSVAVPSPSTSSSQGYPVQQMDRLSQALAGIVGGTCHDLANTLAYGVWAIREDKKRTAATQAKLKRVLEGSFESVQNLHQLARKFYQDNAILPSIAYGDLEEHIKGLLSPRTDARGIALKLQIMFDSDGVLPALLPQLLVAPLAINAIEAMSAQSNAELEISIRIREDIDELALQVTDNGPGFGASLPLMREALPRIRKGLPLIQKGLHTSRVQSAKGTLHGYGLVHLIRLVDRLGGIVEFEDVQPHGATVRVRLPLKM
jgi:DNA-binding response OmpR family regulator